MHAHTNDTEITRWLYIEGVIECSARFEIKLTWYRGQLQEAGPVTLIEWTLPNADTTHNRALAVTLMGEAEVARQEAEIEQQFRDEPPFWATARKNSAA